MPTAMTGTSDISPATTVRVRCNWADNSDSEVDSALLMGATCTSCRASFLPVPSRIAQSLFRKRECHWRTQVKPAAQLLFLFATTLAVTGFCCSAQSSPGSGSERDTAFALEQQGKFSEAEA